MRRWYSTFSQRITPRPDSPLLRNHGVPGAVAPWALGPWIWRDEVSGQDKVEEDLQTLRNLESSDDGLLD